MIGRSLAALFLFFAAYQSCAAQGASNEAASGLTPDTKIRYESCIKDAYTLQQKYVACKTDACRANVKKEFDVWSGKCFKN
jgi:hypothetical protein